MVKFSYQSTLLYWKLVKCIQNNLWNSTYYVPFNLISSGIWKIIFMKITDFMEAEG